MQRIALRVLPLLIFSNVASAHEEAATLGMPDGWSAQTTVAGSYRTLARVKSSERWIIPGFLMGGEALPMPRGFHLDEAMLSGSVGQNSSYAYIKIGQHAGADGLELEHAFVGQRFGDASVLEFGRMSSVMTPYNSPHSSQTPFSDSPLVYDAFWGRQYNDMGLRARTSLQDLGLETGLEIWQGDSFPAERKDAAKGAFDVYLRHSMRTAALGWSFGLFHYQGEADRRKDERYSAEHNHGLDTSTIPVYWFSGRTQVQGLHARLEFGEQMIFGAEGELQFSRNEGELRDATRLSPLESQARGQWASAYFKTDTQLAAIRYERLLFENELSGAAATALATAANLISDKDPYRISAAYNWQWNSELKLRGEWLRDFTSGRKKDMGVVGFVWSYRISSDSSTAVIE